MQLTDEHIAEFQALWCKNYGGDIGKDEALAKGLRLVRLFEIILKHEAQKHAPQEI